MGPMGNPISPIKWLNPKCDGNVIWAHASLHASPIHSRPCGWICSLWGRGDNFSGRVDEKEGLNCPVRKLHMIDIIRRCVENGDGGIFMETRHGVLLNWKYREEKKDMSSISNNAEKLLMSSLGVLQYCLRWRQIIKWKPSQTVIDNSIYLRAMDWRWQVTPWELGAKLPSSGTLTRIFSSPDAPLSSNRSTLHFPIQFYTKGRQCIENAVQQIEKKNLDFQGKTFLSILLRNLW